MSDIYELQLHMDLSVDTPPQVLDALRRHLGFEPTPDDEPDVDWPLLHRRGPALRIGGTLVGELTRAPDAWSLTVRQEIHPDSFDGLHYLLTVLAAHTTGPDPIGQLRFLEDWAPELIIPSKTESGRGEVKRLPLAPAGDGSGAGKPKPFLEDLAL